VRVVSEGSAVIFHEGNGNVIISREREEGKMQLVVLCMVACTGKMECRGAAKREIKKEDVTMRIEEGRISYCCYFA